MQDGVDLVTKQQAPDDIMVAGIALDEFRLSRNGPSEPRRQIVENENVLAGVEQLEHHMAADIAGPAGDQNAHRTPSASGCNSPPVI